MKFSKTVLLAGTLTLFMGSCADESPWGDSASLGAGKINLHLYSSEDIQSEMPKVRSVSTDIVPPELALFNIRMTNTSGTYVKSWNSVSEFEKETEFRPDTYVLEAFYGDASSQGIVKEGEKGYEHSYFYGKSEEIKVEAGKESEIHLQTSLANSVVVIEYSDAFKNYFIDWDTQLITLGETPLKLGNQEGMCYVVPGDVDVVISATQQNGKSVTVNPAVFEAEPKHLYKITYNIYSGEIGHAEKLQVIFNDKPDAEHTIEIDLTDELLSGEGPVITTDGFVSEQTIEALSGSPYEGVVKFNIDSKDGYSQAILTIDSETYKPSFLVNGVIDLCKADAAQQAALTADGIKVIGLYENPERLALVDMTEFCKHLPEGTHNISLVVKDRSRVADASLKVITYPIDLDVAPAGKSIFGRRYADILVSYNGADPTVAGNNPFSFKVGDTASEIKSITKAETTRAFESKDYIYRVAIPDVDADDFEVNLFFNNGSAPMDKTTVEFEYPDYKVDYDPMAKRVMMKITDVNDPEIDFNQPDIQDLFTNRLRVFVDNTEINGENLTVSGDKVVTAKGLAGGDSFNIKTSLRKSAPKSYENEQNLNYEKENQIPNNDFSKVSQTVSFEDINVNGEFTVTFAFWTDKYQVTSDILRNEADGWSSLNDKTCYRSSKLLNTWYIVPSTFVETKGTVTIRSVGYNHNGRPLKNTDAGGTFNTTYYCTDAPTYDELEKQAGELFLGSYVYDVNGDTPDYGLKFETRPSKLAFDYQYTSIDGELASAEIYLFDKDRKEISGIYSILEHSSEQQSIDLILPDYEFGRKVETISIIFRSTTKDKIPALKIPNGTELSEGIINITGNLKKNANDYKAFAMGSELKISNVTLIYE